MMTRMSLVPPASQPTIGRHQLLQGFRLGPLGYECNVRTAMARGQGEGEQRAVTGIAMVIANGLINFAHSGVQRRRMSRQVTTVVRQVRSVIMV